MPAILLNAKHLILVGLPFVTAASFVAAQQQWLGITKDMLIDTQGTIYMMPQTLQRMKLEKPGNKVKVVSLP